jgi:hypothetical protein
MPRPKPDFTPVSIMLRVHPSTAEWIDEKRGDASRSQWLKGLVLRSMKPGADGMVKIDWIRGAAPAPKPSPREVHEPEAPKPFKSRLKGQWKAP